jgi:hypothetical protein
MDALNPHERAWTIQHPMYFISEVLHESKK